MLTKQDNRHGRPCGSQEALEGWAIRLELVFWTYNMRPKTETCGFLHHLLLKWRLSIEQVLELTLAAPSLSALESIA